MDRRRNNTLDVLRLFASYMVVFIHVVFYGRTGMAADALARFAVPLFFLVSGYYSCNTTREKIRRRILHLLRLLVFAVVFYTAFNMLRLLMKGGAGEILPYFLAYTRPENLLKLLVFNVPVHTEHLWYLPAMIYVYWLYRFLMRRQMSEKRILILSLGALTLHLFLGEVLNAFHIPVPSYLMRNFALMGFPFFGLGLLLNQHRDTFGTLPGYLIPVSAAAGVALTLLSCFYLGRNELYVGSVLILFAMVLLFVRYPDREYPRVLTALADCGTYIYIFHPMVSSALSLAYTILGLDYDSSVFLQMIHPLIVCVATTVWAYLLTGILCKISKDK